MMVKVVGGVPALIENTSLRMLLLQVQDLVKRSLLQ